MILEMKMHSKDLWNSCGERQNKGKPLYLLDFIILSYSI